MCNIQNDAKYVQAKFRKIKEIMVLSFVASWTQMVVENFRLGIVASNAVDFIFLGKNGIKKTSYWSLAKICPIYIAAKLKQKLFRFIVIFQRYISAKKNYKIEIYCYTHDQSHYTSVAQRGISSRARHNWICFLAACPRQSSELGRESESECDAVCL